MGPVKDIVVPIRLLDVKILPNSEYEMKTTPDFLLVAYVFEGNGFFTKDLVGNDCGKLILFKDCDSHKVKGGEDGLRFMLFQGKRLLGSIAWRRPIVMNTQKEIDAAYIQLEEGSFIGVKRI